jgi:hypothetical protein
MDTFNYNFNRLVRFDLVRASKLLEIIQSVLVIFVIAFYAGSAIDRFFAPASENMSNMELMRDLGLQLALIVVSAYYIKKIAVLIPFMFSLTSEYVPSKKGEATFGSAIAMAIIFVSVQKNFASKISLLQRRFALN